MLLSWTKQIKAPTSTIIDQLPIKLRIKLAQHVYNIIASHVKHQSKCPRKTNKHGDFWNLLPIIGNPINYQNQRVGTECH